MDPGEQLKAYLKKTETTYEAAGKVLRVSRQTLWSWITGESVPGEAAKAEIETYTEGLVPASAWPIVDKRRKPEEPAA